MSNLQKTINKTSVDAWVHCISSLNRQEYQMDTQRVNYYRWLSRELKIIFKEHLRKEVRVIYKHNGSLIRIEVPIFCGEGIHLTPEFLNDLFLPVSVNFDNDRMIVFELYPEVDIEFKTDDSESTQDTAEDLVLNDEYNTAESEVETISSILEGGR